MPFTEPIQVLHGEKPKKISHYGPFISKRNLQKPHIEKELQEKLR